MSGQEPSGDASKFKLPADAVLKQEIPLQRRMASCVIGIKGASVAKLRRESGAKIHVRPGQGPGELDQVVEVEGSIEAVLLCIRMIDDLLRSEDANYKMAPKPEVTCRFYVLPEMIGPAIIGKAGTHAKHIRERTGVRIEVVGPADGANRQQIVLHGTAERTREAYHLLLGNIRKYAPNLAPGAVPAPLPFPHRPSSGGGSAGRGGGSRYSDRPGPPPRDGGRGYGGARSGSAGAPPPPPPRGAGGYRGYDDYGAPPDPYRPHDPYARAAPAAAPYATAQAPYSTAADPSAAAAAAASAQGMAVAAQQPQMMYILQDGVLKPLAVTYQQAVPAAAPGAAAAQVMPGLAGYAAAPAAAAPTSTGGTTVLYQQAGAAGGATYAYAAPAQQPGAPAAGADASGAAPSWMGAVQQLMAGQVAASSAPLTVGAYPGAAAATYTTAAAQPAQYTVPAGTQYVQYANYPPQ
ncbi:hypothetical protein OEZ85_011775 [Tetradesmus obliquus]|uniref:K Homology domain-containing protein n=1 Tax=Tetradesmus obliquus TaxID=3088 RepID=A0ABY8TRB9_TETOB|nr:hypothetical protein OEZ85_011775 [Tetradesmus obliquus]